MGRKHLWVVAMIGLLCSSGFAEGNWVEQYLQRYGVHQAAAFRTGSPAQTPTQRPLSLTNRPVSLTTDDVIRLLLENNRDVAVNRLAPISSQLAMQVLHRPFQPMFYTIVNMDRIATPSQNQLVGAPSLLELTHDLRIGMDQEKETGTIYRVNFDILRGSSNSAFNIFNPYYNGTITYSLTQKVLRGFGRGVNTRHIRIARNDLKKSELQFELEMMDLVREALAAYWDLTFAVQDVKVKQNSLELATRTREDNRVQVQVGTLAPIDLIQAEADVAARNEALITAEYNVDILQDRLKKLISNDLDPGSALTRLNLVEQVRKPNGNDLPTLDQAIQDALENRPELRIADYDIGTREIEVEFARNETRPILDITASYTQTGLGGTQTIREILGQETGPTLTIPGGIGQVFNQLFHFTHGGYATGFNLQIPIRNQAADAEYERAVNERRISTLQKATTAQEIVVEVRNAYTEVRKHRARVETTRVTRELALRKLDAEQKKFELGTSTVRFVLEEQRNLAQTETDEIQALVNYTKAIVDFNRATGTILERNNIDIDKVLPLRTLYKN